MKRAIIILSIIMILFATVVAAALYGGLDKTDEVETLTLKQLYESEFPEGMPDVGMNPVSCTAW